MLPYFLITILAIGQPETAERQLLYAESLFDAGVYDSSIVEYKRFLFYNPRTNLSDLARYRIAQSYYYHGDLERAQELFTEFTRMDADSPLHLHAQLMLGKTYFDDKDYSTARTIFFQVRNSDGDRRLLAQAQYLRGWSYIHDREWFKAIAEFRKVRDIQPDNPFALASTELADTTLANNPLPYKSPKRAQWLSTFLPGTGQIYIGKVRNGLLAFAVNAAFFYTLGDAIYDKRYVDATGIFLIGWRFYLGNRSNAKKWASEYNRKLEEELIQQLKVQSEAVEQMETVGKWEMGMRRVE